MSGFVLSMSYQKKASYSSFFKTTISRYIRLAIPSTVSCILAYFIFSFHVDKTSLSTWAQNLGSLNLDIFDAVYQGAILPYIHGKSDYNWVLWTMRIELIGSILVLILHTIMNEYKIKNKSKIILSSIIMLTILLLLTRNTLFLGLVSFLFGTYLNYSKEKINDNLCLAMLIAGVYFAGVHNDSISYKLFYNITHYKTYDVLNFISGILITTSIIKTNRFNNFLEMRLVKILGELSFSMYLVHLPMLYIVTYPLFNIMNKSHSFIYSVLTSSIPGVIVVIITSFIFKKIIDEKSIKISKKI